MWAEFRSEDWEEKIWPKIEQRWFMHGAIVLVDRRLTPSSRYLERFADCCKTMEGFLKGLSSTLGKGSGALRLSWDGEMAREGSATPMRFSLWTQMIRDHGQITYGIPSGSTAMKDAVVWP